MGRVSDFARRVGRGVQTALEALGNMPVKCGRCQKEYKFGDLDLRFVYGIPQYDHSLRRFCPTCLAAINAEYAYRCEWCGKRHNLAKSPICGDCQAKQHPKEAKRIAHHNKRAAEVGLESSLALSDWLTTLDDFDWSCWRCGSPFEALDHYNPIAHGGGTTADNCFPICNRCNSLKGATPPADEVRKLLDSLQTHERIEEYKRARWTRLDVGAPLADPEVPGSGEAH